MNYDQIVHRINETKAVEALAKWKERKPGPPLLAVLGVAAVAHSVGLSVVMLMRTHESSLDMDTPNANAPIVAPNAEDAEDREKKKAELENHICRFAATCTVWEGLAVQSACLEKPMNAQTMYTAICSVSDPRRRDTLECVAKILTEYPDFAASILPSVHASLEQLPKDDRRRDALRFLPQGNKEFENVGTVKVTMSKVLARLESEKKKRTFAVMQGPELPMQAPE